MPAKGLRRQARTSLYRWVAVRLLQKRFLSPGAPSDRSCARDARDTIKSISREITGVSSSVPHDNTVCSPDRGATDGVAEKCTAAAPLPRPSPPPSPSLSLESALKEPTIGPTQPLSSIVHDTNQNTARNESPEVPSRSANEVLSASSLSPSSYGYEQAVTDEEGGISSYIQAAHSNKSTLNGGFNSLDSSLPSIYATSKESSDKDTTDVMQGYNSLTYQEEKFSSEISTNCSETLSDNNDNFPSEELTKGGLEWLQSAAAGGIDESGLRQSLRAENKTATNCGNDGDKILTHLSTEYDTEADVSLSVIVNSETPSRVKVIEKRLLSDVAPTRGSVQSLIVHTLCQGFETCRKWDSIGVLYGKELTEIRNKVRERLLSMLRERRRKKSWKEPPPKMGHVPRPPKRRSLRKKEKRVTKKPGRANNAQSKKQCLESTEQDAVPKVSSPGNHSIKSPADSVSHRRVSQSLSKCDLRRTESSLAKSPSSSCTFDQVETPVGGPNSQSDSLSILSSAERDKNRHKRGSPPPRSASFNRSLRIESDKNGIIYPLPDDDDSPVRKSLLYCCPCFVSFKNKGSKFTKSSERHGNRHNRDNNRDFSSERRPHRHPRRRHSSRSPSSDATSRRRRRHHHRPPQRPPQFRDSFTNSHVSTSYCLLWFTRVPVRTASLALRLHGRWTGTRELAT